MTIDKQALRERYSPQPSPKCHICGIEMTVQRMSGSRITYGCTGAIYDDDGCHYADGRSIADDHYEQSRVTVVDVSDPDVLALLDELDAAEKRNAELIREAENARYEWGEAQRNYDSAKKRMAELEARAFNLAILDVIAERQRQQSAEGWTPEHDDEHCNGELAMAAVCYINETGTVNRNGGKPWGVALGCVMVET